MVFKHFTARDVISRWDVIEVHRQATAATAAGFLDTLCARMPFPIRAVQVDGGSEFHAVFEARLSAPRALRPFVLPPALAQAQRHGRARPARTHTEEFYEIRPFCDFSVAALDREARAWERVYNTCARIRRSAISPRSSSCAAHAAKLKLRGLTRLRARVRHNPPNSKCVTYVPNEYKNLPQRLSYAYMTLRLI